MSDDIVEQTVQRLLNDVTSVPEMRIALQELYMHAFRAGRRRGAYDGDMDRIPAMAGLVEAIDGDWLEMAKTVQDHGHLQPHEDKFVNDMILLAGRGRLSTKQGRWLQALYAKTVRVPS